MEPDPAQQSALRHEPDDHPHRPDRRRDAHSAVTGTCTSSRFMLFFGPISSLFDFGTFAIMLWAFHAGPPLFRSGWFVESLATQTFVVLVIRTRRIPFWRSRPSRALLSPSLRSQRSAPVSLTRRSHRHSASSRSPPCSSLPSPSWSSRTWPSSSSQNASSSNAYPRPRMRLEPTSGATDT